MKDLTAIYAEASGVAHDTASHDAGLRAVEAAVRADQIERDAAIVRNWSPRPTDPYEPYQQFAQVEAAIRAQLEGVSNAE